MNLSDLLSVGGPEVYTLTYTGNVTFDINNGKQQELNPSASGFTVTLPNIGTDPAFIVLLNTSDYDTKVSSANGVYDVYSKDSFFGFWTGSVWLQSSPNIPDITHDITTDNFSVTEHVFESGINVGWIDTLKLSNNKFLIVYAGSSGIFSKIGVVSGSTITFGARQQLSSNLTLSGVKCNFVNDAKDKVLITWSRYTSYYDGSPIFSIVALYEGGTTFTSIGAPVQHGANTYVYYVGGICKAAENKFILNYQSYYYEGGNDGANMVVGEVNGTVITFGTPLNIYTDTGSGTPASGYIGDMAYLEENKVIFDMSVVFSIVEISGTTPTMTTSSNISAYSPSGYHLLPISPTKVAFTYIDYYNNVYNGFTVILGVSGTTVSVLSRTYVGEQISGRLKSTLLSDNKVLIAYSEPLNNSYGTINISDILGNLVTMETPYVFKSYTCDPNSCCYVEDGNIIVIYLDSNNNNYGTVALIQG